jgi:hypothetical protein
MKNRTGKAVCLQGCSINDKSYDCMTSACQLMTAPVTTKLTLFKMTTNKLQADEADRSCT